MGGIIEKEREREGERERKKEREKGEGEMCLWMGVCFYVCVSVWVGKIH